MPLSLPTGEETTSWLQLRGVNSPTFEAAVSVADREQLKLTGKEDKMSAKDYNAARRLIKCKMLGSLVADWSDEDQECTPEAVITFLEGAPQIQRAIDNFAVQDRHFCDDSFTKPPTN